MNSSAQEKLFCCMVFFQSVFLPQGYPDSVSEDYVVYQIWDTIQVRNLKNIFFNPYIFLLLYIKISLLILVQPGKADEISILYLFSQAFCSSITGSLATHALLKGVGVGDDNATVMAATITWIMQSMTISFEADSFDRKRFYLVPVEYFTVYFPGGAGMVGQIVFAWLQGYGIDTMVIL